MFAVKGFYNGNSVIVNEPIPTKEQYDVIITFISSAEENKRPDDERRKSYDFLMNFPKKSLPENFDCKKELMEALDEKYNSAN
jgi:hypothetical protein